MEAAVGSVKSNFFACQQIWFSLVRKLSEQSELSPNEFDTCREAHGIAPTLNG